MLAPKSVARATLIVLLVFFCEYMYAASASAPLEIRGLRMNEM